MDCLFCNMVAGSIPTNKVYEDEEMLAFYDIDPQAPVHILVIPKRHIASVDHLTPQDAVLVGKLFAQMPALAKAAGLEKGYRVVTNIGSEGGQTVGHLHFHLLGGRQLQWPPG